MILRKTPIYSNDELNDALTRIERLERLYANCEQTLRLNGQKMAPAQLADFRQRLERYESNVKTSQLYYQRMLEKLNK